MEIHSFTVNVSQKINLGNYESKGIGITLSATLDEADDLQECKQELTEKANSMVDAEVDKVKNGKGVVG